MLDIDSIKKSLSNSSFIDKIYFFSEISSTNDFTKSLNDEDNVLVIAEYQTAGRGRFERIWESEKGSNLTFSIKKKIELPLKNIQSVNFFFSYYLIEGLKNFLGNLAPKPDYELFIKWPNDIMLNSKKICGILIENNPNKNEFIVGFGLNVNQETFNKDYDDNTTSLKKLIGAEIDRNLLLISLISHFERNINLLINGHFDIIYKFWRGCNNLIGKEIVFETPGHVKKRAKVINFKEDGGIEIDSDNKKITYYSGDIKILKGWQ